MSPLMQLETTWGQMDNNDNSCSQVRAQQPGTVVALVCNTALPRLDVGTTPQETQAAQHQRPTAIGQVQSTLLIGLPRHMRSSV